MKQQNVRATCNRLWIPLLEEFFRKSFRNGRHAVNRDLLSILFENNIFHVQMNKQACVLKRRERVDFPMPAPLVVPMQRDDGNVVQTADGNFLQILRRRDKFYPWVWF